MGWTNCLPTTAPGSFGSGMPSLATPPTRRSRTAAAGSCTLAPRRPSSSAVPAPMTTSTCSRCTISTPATTGGPGTSPVPRRGLPRPSSRSVTHRSIPPGAAAARHLAACRPPTGPRRLKRSATNERMGCIASRRTLHRGPSAAGGRSGGAGPSVPQAFDLAERSRAIPKRCAGCGAGRRLDGAMTSSRFSSGRGCRRLTAW